MEKAFRSPLVRLGMYTLGTASLGPIITAAMSAPAVGLEIKTVALGMDYELYTLFRRLQDLRGKHKEFAHAVENADRLLFLHNQLRHKRVQPLVHDRADAFIYTSECQYSLFLLSKEANQKDSPRNAVIIHRLYELIFAALNRHVLEIFRLTRHV